MKWIPVTNMSLPDFGVPVFAYCRIYGRYIAIYERIEDSTWGQWRHCGLNETGFLPPMYWANIEYPSAPDGAGESTQEKAERHARNALLKAREE